MQLLNLSARTLKEEEEDDSPSVISSHHKPSSLPRSTTHTNHTSSSPLWFVLSVYGWGWLRLLYAIYSQEMENYHYTTRVCLDEIGLICLVLSGLSILLAMVGLLRWSSLLITPFLATQFVWTGGLAGGLIYQSYTEFTNGSRMVHVYAFCLLSMSVMIGALIGIYVTLRSMDHIRRTPIDKRKGRIELFANPLFSPDSVNAPREIARDDSLMDGSMSLTEFKTPSSLIALFEDTHELPQVKLLLLGAGESALMDFDEEPTQLYSKSLISIMREEKDYMEEEQEKVVKVVNKYEPRHGELWTKYSKNVANWRKTSEEIVRMATREVTIPT